MKICEKIKAKFKKLYKSDCYIILTGIIAAILLLSNLLFSSYTLIKHNLAIDEDISRIEHIEAKLVEIESKIERLDLEY